VISVVDPVSGEPTAQLYEGRPDTRTKQSLFFDNKIHLQHDVLDLSARAYRDDWGVSSVTADARYRFQLGSDYYIEPHLRYYKQGAADFYRYYLVQGDAPPEFASSDARLADFRAQTYGIKFGMRLSDDSEFTLRFENYTQHYNGHPADAIGQLQQQDLSPDLKGFTALLGYTTKF
jgi:hypothetical protein